MAEKVALCIHVSSRRGRPLSFGSATARYRKKLEALLQGLFDTGHRGSVVLVTTYAMRYTTISGEPLVFGAFNRALATSVFGARTENAVSMASAMAISSSRLSACSGIASSS